MGLSFRFMFYLRSLTDVYLRILILRIIINRIVYRLLKQMHKKNEL